MALLAPQQIDLDGITPTFVDADAGDDGGDTFKPRPNVFLEVVNGGDPEADPVDPDVTATVDSVARSNFGTDNDKSITVAPGESGRIGPFEAARFADPETGLATVTYDVTDNITVGVFRL